MPLSSFHVRPVVSFRDRDTITLAELRLRYRLKTAERELATMRAAGTLPTRAEYELRRRDVREIGCVNVNRHGEKRTQPGVAPVAGFGQFVGGLA